jgi:hypothetical protein
MLGRECNVLDGAVKMICPWDFSVWPQMGRTIIFGVRIFRQSIVFIY